MTITLFGRFKIEDVLVDDWIPIFDQLQAEKFGWA